MSAHQENMKTALFKLEAHLLSDPKPTKENQERLTRTGVEILTEALMCLASIADSLEQLKNRNY